MRSTAAFGMALASSMQATAHHTKVRTEWRGLSPFESARCAERADGSSSVSAKVSVSDTGGRVQARSSAASSRAQAC